MNLFFVALVLALVWGGVRADFTPANLMVGFVLGFFCLWVVRHRFDPGAFARAGHVLRLALLFLEELVMSSLRVARDTLSPRMDFKPVIVAVPLDVTRDIEITLLTNLISLTPGTLSVDVSKDCSTLYVHAMDVDDPAELRREIKQGFERRIMEAMG